MVIVLLEYSDGINFLYFYYAGIMFDAFSIMLRKLCWHNQLVFKFTLFWIFVYLESLNYFSDL